MILFCFFLWFVCFPCFHIFSTSPFRTFATLFEGLTNWCASSPAPRTISQRNISFPIRGWLKTYGKCRINTPYISRVFPKIGVGLQNHPFLHRVWNHYFHHPFWGKPIFGTIHMGMIILALKIPKIMGY